MIFKTEKEEDWKELLNEDAKKVLFDLFENAKKHKIAYSKADDVKIAQIWAALVEMKKEINNLKDSLDMYKMPWKAIVELGEAEKKRAIEKIVNDLIKPETEEAKEATKKLIDTLMKL